MLALDGHGRLQKLWFLPEYLRSFAFEQTTLSPASDEIIS
jgi:hypothetical protein